jgi:formate dehydrogenase iron-sulfur subunit
MKVFVPRDSAALAMGADGVAEAIKSEAARRGQSVEVIRNGSRGLLWLEPLVEVETPQGRVAFGPVTPDDVSALFDAGFGAHALALGNIEAHPFLTRQTRLTFARCGKTDPVSLPDYEAHGGLTGLRKALSLTPAQVVETVTASGLRGRGGAGFPTGIKWKTVNEAEGAQKYIVCNADEGDSGTFADRMLMEGDPFTLIEGMAIAGYAVGATQGIIYLRSEYPNAANILEAALKVARTTGLLGDHVLGQAFKFDIRVQMAAGAYVCGEETSLLNSLEGRRGIVRAKPPLPALQGFMAKPTVVNNVLTLGSVPHILAHGAEGYAALGLGRSKGTMPIQLGGNLKHTGLFEAPFGITLGELVNDVAGGSWTGRPLRAVQVGGPLGAYMGAGDMALPFTYEHFDAAGGLIGHAGIVGFDDQTDMLEMARFAFEFCAKESCGKCTPCRIGSVRGAETIARARQDASALDLVKDLCVTMKDGSLCALGGFTPYPVMSAITKFPEDFALTRTEAAE